MEAIKKMIVNGQKVIVRTEHAGVFYGVVTEMEGQTAEVKDCRRIWYWYSLLPMVQRMGTGRNWNHALSVLGSKVSSLPNTCH